MAQISDDEIISMYPENPGRISMSVWAEVNDRLAEMGLDEALWGDMRRMVGWSAQGAAEHIAALRRDAAKYEHRHRPEDAMRKAERAILDLLQQLQVSDEYAKQDNPGPVPSVWQLQNGLIRDKAREVLEALGEMAH